MRPPAEREHIKKWGEGAEYAYATASEKSYIDGEHTGPGPDTSRTIRIETV